MIFRRGRGFEGVNGRPPGCPPSIVGHQDSPQSHTEHGPLTENRSHKTTIVPAQVQGLPLDWVVGQFQKRES